MPRPIRNRRVRFTPTKTYFKPAGIELRKLEEVILAYEELEALHLRDLGEFTQEQAAKQMDISQPTFHRLISGARRKVVEALVQGKAIKIDGGNYIMKKEHLDCANQVVAISSASQELEGDVDSRFGRCKYFVLVSLQDGKVVSSNVLENSSSESRGGVGVAVAQMLAKHNVDSIISGNIGPRALDVLEQFGIQPYQAQGSKKEAIDKLVEGKLELINQQ
ncbi:MAG: DUF134 domain-containing protein [Chlamydiota bacterium]